MFINETKMRVRYAETDQMGYVYYGNYATYFEVGRVEALREMGVSYKSLEEDGVMLPVVDYQTKYIKPIYYDELITVKTIVPKIPAARIYFEYEIYNEKNELTTKGTTTLVFVDTTTQRPIIAPKEVMEVLANYF